MKKVTQKKIAQDLGLSQAAVSLILNRHSHIKLSEDTKKKVWEHADKLGYLPSVGSRVLRGQRIRSIGVLHFGGTNESGARYLTAVIQKIQEYGYTPLVFDIFWFSRHQERAIAHFLEAKVEGLILTGYSRLFEMSALEAVYREQIPVVGVRGLPIPEIPQWFSDKEDSMCKMAHHLIGLGHTELGLLARTKEQGETDQFSFPIQAERGIRKAIAESKRDIDLKVVNMPNSYPFVTKNPYEVGYEAMRQMYEKGLPSAIMCLNDIWAIAGMRFLLDKGVRIPDDVAITGRDDTAGGRYAAVPLTTIDPNIEQTVAMAVTALHEMIITPTPQRANGTNTTVPASLVIRASCGNPAWNNEKQVMELASTSVHP